MKSNFDRLLAKDSNFAREDAVDVIFTYDFDDPRLAQLNEKWSLRQTAGEGGTQSRLLRRSITPYRSRIFLTYKALCV